MSERPAESLKDAANQLAHLIVTQEKDENKINTLKKKLNLDDSASSDRNLQTPSAEIKNGKKNSAPEERVGIWIPKSDKGKKYYIRDLKYKKEFGFWARVHEIAPKGSKKRIVCLGESVFRGTLLDPFYTPVSVLRTLLDSKPGLLQVELIDLARSECSIHLLTELCSACTALKPDVLVVFAGNNWINSFEFSETLMDEMVKVMETEERFTGLTRILENQYKRLVASFMKHLARLAETHSLQVVYVIPEFNLLDFCSNPAQRMNLWPKGETGKWLTLEDEIEQALKKGDMDRVELLCREMIALNEGNPYGYELLGRSKLKRGLLSEASRYLRMGLDTAMYRSANVPCCISVIRNTLLEEAAKYKIPVVNLVEVFNRFQSGKPPGRELFLDYCHLTVKGIQVAMAAAAQKLFSLLTNKEVSMDELMATAPEPGSDVIARSHFFAAVHNAHRGEQPYEILYYHCLQALKHSESVKDLMLNYIDMASRHTVWALNKSCEKLVGSAQMDQFFTILQPRNHYIMDIDLVDAVVAALKHHGIDVGDRVLSIRKKEHGFVRYKIDLLESYYHLSSYVTTYRSNDSCYRAFTPQSRFFLVSGNDNDVLLKMTYRVPGGNLKKETVGFKLNDSISAGLPTYDEWQNFSLVVPGELLKNGINVITLHWPPNVKYKKEGPGTQPPADRVKSIHRMMYPIYGEVHMFSAEKK